jgi:hypothetical protein
MWSGEMVCLLLASAVRPHKPRGLVLTRDRLTTNSPPVPSLPFPGQHSMSTARGALLGVYSVGVFLPVFFSVLSVLNLLADI